MVEISQFTMPTLWQEDNAICVHCLVVPTVFIRDFYGDVYCLTCFKQALKYVKRFGRPSPLPLDRAKRP